MRANCNDNCNRNCNRNCNCNRTGASYQKHRYQVSVYYASDFSQWRSSKGSCVCLTRA